MVFAQLLATTTPIIVFLRAPLYPRHARIILAQALIIQDCRLIVLCWKCAQFATHNQLHERKSASRGPSNIRRNQYCECINTIVAAYSQKRNQQFAALVCSQRMSNPTSTTYVNSQPTDCISTFAETEVAIKSRN